MKAHLRWFAVASAVLFSVQPTYACVACGSPAAHHLRQALGSSHLPMVLAAVAAPFPVLLGAAVGLSRWLGRGFGGHA